MKQIILIILTLSAVSFISSDMDDMFFDDSVVKEITEDDMAEDMEKQFLITENTEIGGNILFKMESEIIPGESETTTPSLGGKIYLDARPEEDFRAFIKGDIDVPFNEEDNSNVFRLTEMFTDFNYNDLVYFRAGKFKINWGVGRYYSPADVLNITQIDPDNPDEEREGPVSLKTNIPVGLNNLNLYLIAPNGYNSVTDTTYALNYSFLVMDTEITIGGIYRNDFAPKGTLTMTGGLLDVDLYSEMLISYGSDLSILEKDEEVYFSGTVGGSYSLSFDDVATSFVFNGQYYFNGELEEHSILGSASVLDIFDSGVNLTLTSQNELKGSTGKVSGKLSYNLMELFSLSGAINYNYSEEQPVSLEFTVTLGGGAF